MPRPPQRIGCTVAGCARTHYAKGRCQRHYMADRRPATAALAEPQRPARPEKTPVTPVTPVTRPVPDERSLSERYEAHVRGQYPGHDFEVKSLKSFTSEAGVWAIGWVSFCGRWPWVARYTDPDGSAIAIIPALV